MIQLSKEQQKQAIDLSLHMALESHEKYCRLVQPDLVQVFICSERAKGLSLKQIAIKLKVSHPAIQKKAKRCA